MTKAPPPLPPPPLPAGLPPPRNARPEPLRGRCHRRDFRHPPPRPQGRSRDGEGDRPQAREKASPGWPERGGRREKQTQGSQAESQRHRKERGRGGEGEGERGREREEGGSEAARRPRRVARERAGPRGQGEGQRRRARHAEPPPPPRTCPARAPRGAGGSARSRPAAPTAPPPCWQPGPLLASLFPPARPGGCGLGPAGTESESARQPRAEEGAGLRAVPAGQLASPLARRGPRTPARPQLQSPAARATRPGSGLDGLRRRPKASGEPAQRPPARAPLLRPAGLGPALPARAGRQWERGRSCPQAGPPRHFAQTCFSKVCAASGLHRPLKVDRGSCGRPPRAAD